MQTAPAVNQPELYTYRESDNLTGIDIERVFAPVCLLDHKYYLEQYPLYYFIVRNDQNSKDPELQRVCLYKDGYIDEHLQGNDKPFTRWISNDLRNARHIKTIYHDMEEKASDIEVVKKPKTHANGKKF